jgi:Skp family chaperone for outer membrane proteins
MTDFDVLLIALKQAGGTPHVDELLDLLYLSRQQLFSSKEENEVRGGIQHPLSPGGGTGGQGGVSTPAKNKDDFREVDPSSLDASVKPQIRPARVDLPKPVHFTSRLSLERALWPLRRRTPLQASAMLDELATSETAADLWLYNLLAWQPKFLKERTRWYDIVLLVDTAPSMKIWGQEVTEFSGLFAKQKFIRRFTPRFVNTNSDDDIEKLITSFNGKVLQRGRTLFLVVSDCIGKTWRNGKIPAFLETKMSIAQVVLVQPLPQALWYLSAVHDAGQGYVAPRERSEPNENMLAYPPEYRKFYDGFLPLPIVQLKETSVLRWAKAASGLRRQVLPAFYFASPEIEEDTSSWDITRRLGEFNKRASNDAVRLARLLPILIEKDEGSFDLQDARSFAQALEPSWGNDVLAEVLLGKLIEIKLDAFNPEQVMFEFYPGVDEMLSRSLTSTEVRDAWYALSQQKGNERKTGLQEYFGSLQDVRDLQDDEVILSHSLRDRIFRGVGLGQPDPLQGLRRLMQARPQVAKELAGWERNLRNLANKLQQVQIDSPEAAAALNVAQTAHGVDKLHQEIEEKRIALQQATADLRLDEITRVITRGVSISNQLNSSDEFAEFPAILRELMDNVNDLKAEAEQAKINISVELNVYLTLMQSEKYDLALDILYKSQEGGILQVPVSFGSDAVTDIMSAIHQVRQNLIDYLKKKIGERLTSAKNALATQSDFGLLNAEIELKQARKLCENQYVGADLEKEEIVTKELYELEEGVNQVLEQRAEALELLKVVRSLDEKDALQKLGALKYPWREEIESLKTEIQNKARDSKVRPPNEPLRTRLISILETTAHEVLDQGQTELAVRLIKARDLAKEMGEGSLSSDLRAKLEDLAGEDFLRASVPELYENLTPVMESVRLEAFPKKNTEEIPNILADSQLENALSDLRRLMQARPQAVDELAAWEQNLRNLATSIQPEQRNSPEIVAALNLTQAARDLGKLYKTIQKNRTELLDAATRKQLGEISKIITITTSILNQLQDGKEFAEFPPILHDLLTDAKDLSDEANTAKVDVGAKLNVFITLAQVGKYDSALDELYKMLKDGILQVPVAFGDHDLIDIFSVITRTLNEFVNYSKQKIAERLTNAENALARRVDSGLLDAETELNQAKELCQNRYVSEYLSHE